MRMKFSLEWPLSAIASPTKDQEDLVSQRCAVKAMLRLLISLKCLMLLLWIWDHQYHHKLVLVAPIYKRLSLLVMISDWTRLGLQSKVSKAAKTWTTWESAKFLSVDGEAATKISQDSGVETVKDKNQSSWEQQDTNSNRSTSSKLLYKGSLSSRRTKSTCAASK